MIQHLPNGTVHRERRTQLDANCVQDFRCRLNEIKEHYPPEPINNLDQTCCRLDESLRRVISEKEAMAFKIRATSGEKKSQIGIGARPCSGDNLLLLAIGKESDV
jgi:hypothetical protein